MSEIFSWLYHALDGSAAIALFAAFSWGIASVLLSPCHLSGIPLIIGFIDKQGRISVKRAFYLSLLFAAGIIITIAAIGVITAALGRLMGDIGTIGNYFVAAIFLIVGLYLWDVIPAPWSGASGGSMKYRGFIAAFLLGLIFGIGVGPCTFAYMAPMLGITFRIAATEFIFASALLAAFAVGHCSVIVLAGTLTEKVQQYLNWTEKTKSAIILRRVCGTLIILAGIYLIFG